MKRSSNQLETTSENLFTTLKHSWKSLITIALFFVVTTLLVKVGIKSTMPEPSSVLLDSITIHKLSLIRQYAKSVNLSDKVTGKVEDAYIKKRYNQYPLDVVNDSLSFILNKKLTGNDSIEIGSLRIDLFEVKIKSDSNFLSFYNELARILTRKQVFDVIQIIQPNYSSKNY